MTTASGHTSFLGEEPESAKHVTADEGEDATRTALGAPVEVHNPLGYDVGFTSAVFLNLSQMIGASLLFIGISFQALTVTELTWIHRLEYTQHRGQFSRV